MKFGICLHLNKTICKLNKSGRHILVLKYYHLVLEHTINNTENCYVESSLTVVTNRLKFTKKVYIKKLNLYAKFQLFRSGLANLRATCGLRRPIFGPRSYNIW